MLQVDHARRYRAIIRVRQGQHMDERQAPRSLYAELAVTASEARGKLDMISGEQRTKITDIEQQQNFEEKTIITITVLTLVTTCGRYYSDLHRTSCLMARLALPWRVSACGEVDIGVIIILAVFGEACFPTESKNVISIFSDFGCIWCYFDISNWGNRALHHAVVSIGTLGRLYPMTISIMQEEHFCSVAAASSAFAVLQCCLQLAAGQ
eukprot:6177685-Pleurochrysis_carterae.AAC.1